MQQRTRVKICGIGSVEIALHAVAQGADAIGLVFYPPSPRHVEIQQAAEIVDALPAFVTAVGLFVNEQPDVIEDIVDRTGIHLLQFHGNECPDYCAAFRQPYIKALRMKADVDVLAECQRYAGARSLLLDSYRPGTPGGTGETFNWEQIPPQLRQQIILAGGLSAGNVSEAIARVRPYAVDVSGGVESSRGVKSAEKITQFMRGVNIAN